MTSVGYVTGIGQYNGKSEPLPEYHVKIAGFDEKVYTNTSGPTLFY